MKRIDIIIEKRYVYEEVAKASSYAGVKQVGQEGSYERIWVKDSDRTALERLWDEACQTVTERLKEFVVEANTDKLDAVNVEPEGSYILKLDVSQSYCEALNDSVQRTLTEFVTNTILSKWYMVANKDDAEGYATLAADMMERARRMLYDKRRPQRVPVNEGGLGMTAGA